MALDPRLYDAHDLRGMSMRQLHPLADRLSDDLQGPFPSADDLANYVQVLSALDDLNRRWPWKDRCVCEHCFQGMSDEDGQGRVC